MVHLWMLIDISEARENFKLQVNHDWLIDSSSWAPEAVAEDDL